MSCCVRMVLMQNDKPVLVLVGGRYVNPKHVVMVDQWKEIVMLHLIGHSLAISFEDWDKLRRHVEMSRLSKNVLGPASVP